MEVIIIVAEAENHAIGKDNKLLWHLPADMKYFKETTMGYPIITGRKNYFSIPEKFRPLPDRENIVISRNKELDVSGAELCHSLDEALEIAKAKKKDKVFIIGGGEVYKEAIGKATAIYLTRVHIKLAADTFFPELGSEWKIVSEEFRKKDDKNPYDLSFLKYSKVKV